ncbi:uncharacterized protein LOC108217634 isoform X3 [Daucus carota subsp. sativus]|uniref:uncharacterized protein LOC108217634 isoform X3 n=1 Tax=Daucus carota subsp. sativus TaxID=79200 RepID=UPI00308291F6
MAVKRHIYPQLILNSKIVPSKKTFCTYPLDQFHGLYTHEQASGDRISNNSSPDILISPRRCRVSFARLCRIRIKLPRKERLLSVYLTILLRNVERQRSNIINIILPLLEACNDKSPDVRQEYVQGLVDLRSRIMLVVEAFTFASSVGQKNSELNTKPVT